MKKDAAERNHKYTARNVLPKEGKSRFGRLPKDMPKLQAKRELSARDMYVKILESRSHLRLEV